MSEINHYEDLLITYQNQEAPLAEKQQEVKELQTKYEHTMQRLIDTRKRCEQDKINLNSKQLKLMKNLHQISNTCEEAGFIWNGVREMQTGIDASQKEVENLSEQHIGIVQGIAKDLKQLDNNLQYETVTAEIENYKKKTEISKERLAKLTQEYDELSKFDAELSEYQLPENMAEIMAEICKNENNYPKKLSEIDAEIERIKKNLKTIAEKEKELTENLY